ncbi:PhnA domain-containing protein [Flavobacterium agrisoli]|uniref:PhnA domain-containing protein n=1 Tax=Flavobacterium agrisoli TaxID=2793066 RepID=A0A934UII8_9FLAO|nr:alkylphosphonate utilization protein [Flavobacterium agrisoli]MBK0368911.1 PhnA domain-containing protein [Flavobacterium agrisoli]
MNLEKELHQRSQSKCEICSSVDNLSVYTLLPTIKGGLDESVLVCEKCLNQTENPEQIDANHFRCLNDSIWSEHQAVKVLSWRLLHHLRNEDWPQELLEMMYLDEETLAWAKSGVADEDETKLVHRDCNGVILEHGDSVVLIKDLKVKGSSMVAKQGTAVRNIRLDHENAEYIEGKVDGQQIVIITQYVKKT